MRLVLARHGRTRANAEGLIQGSTLDPPLDAEGWAQAERLAAEVGEVDGVYASPLLRARQTALVVAAAQQLPLSGTLQGFREFSWGDLDGKRRADVENDFQATLARWRAGDLTHRAPNGESPEWAWSRAHAAARRLAERHPDERILVVAHARVNMVLLAGLAGDLSRMEDFEQHNCGFTEVNLLEAEAASPDRGPSGLQRA